MMREVRLIDVKAVLRMACRDQDHLLGDLLNAAGRDRSRRQAVRDIVGEYREAESDFIVFATRATPAAWARLLAATRKLSALIKARHEKIKEAKLT